MAFVFNSATGKFEQRKTPATTGKTKDGGTVPPPLKPLFTPPSSTAAPTTTQPVTTTTGTIPAGKINSRGYGYTPAPNAPKAGSTSSSRPRASSTDINDLIQQEITAIQGDVEDLRKDGQEPTSGWYESRMLNLNFMLSQKDTQDKAAAERIKAANDRLEKAAAAKAAAARSAAERAAAEQERKRGLQAGREAEAALRNDASRIKQEAIARIAGLYDPMKTRSEDELKQSLADVTTAFGNAETQVRAAGTQFAESFQPGAAYESVPFATYSVADNPLLAALQQQGAGTGEVEAATGLARQSAEQATALEKWASSQLATSQKNYEEAMRRAASGGVTAALQDLAMRKPVVEAGIQSDYRKILDELARERTQAEETAGSDYDKAITAANELAAKTTASFAPVKKKEEKKKTTNKGTTSNSGGSTSKPGTLKNIWQEKR